MKPHAILTICATLFFGLISPANATESYPDKPIRLIVPYSAGGPTDIVGRVVADKLARSLGQTVIVENKAGANSMIGVGHVARAQPDGYTLLLTTNSVVVNEFMYEKPTYDALEDLRPISLVANNPFS